MSKPYGPIRRWLDKIGLLSGGPSVEHIFIPEVPKPEFKPKPEPEPEPELLIKQELEVNPAVTTPLAPETNFARFPTRPKTDEEVMKSKGTQTGNTTFEPNQPDTSSLLDLGDFEPAPMVTEGDLVLDLDLDEMPQPAVVADSITTRAVVDRSPGADDLPLAERGFAVPEVAETEFESAETTVAERAEPTVDPMADTQRMMHPTITPVPMPEQERAFTEPQILEGETLGTAKPVAGSGQISVEQLSAEAIDAIARRAVEMLSERAVQEIAWEVVPQLAELMIRRQLEEKNS